MPQRGKSLVPRQIFAFGETLQFACGWSIKIGSLTLKSMLVIRFFRVGKKNQPSFKIVVTDKRSKPRAGRFVEEVGFLNPLTKEKILKEERVKYWISVGAKPSPSVFNLLVSEKIIKGKKIPKHKKSKEKEIKEEKQIPEAKKEPIPEKPAEEKIEEPKKEEKNKEEAPKEEKKETSEKPAEEIKKEETSTEEEKK